MDYIIYYLNKKKYLMSSFSSSSQSYSSAVTTDEASVSSQSNASKRPRRLGTEGTMVLPIELLDHITDHLGSSEIAAVNKLSGRLWQQSVFKQIQSLRINHPSLFFLKDCLPPAMTLNTDRLTPGYVSSVTKIFQRVLVPDQIHNIRQQVLTNAQQRVFLTNQLRLSLECYTLGAAQAQSYQDNALRKLASVLKEQIPTMPQGDVDTIRAWFVDLANQPAIQTVTELNLEDKQLAVLPPEIGALVNLQWFNLSYNQISVIL